MSFHRSSWLDLCGSYGGQRTIQNPETRVQKCGKGDNRGKAWRARARVLSAPEHLTQPAAGLESCR